MITFNATMKDTGVYKCLAENSVATVTRNLSLTVYGMHVLLITKICSHNMYHMLSTSLYLQLQMDVHMVAILMYVECLKMMFYVSCEINKWNASSQLNM